MKFYSHLKYVAIELTNVCNLKCKKCWSQSPQLRPPRAKGYISQELFTKVISELSKDASMHSVALHYAGESLLHPNFTEFSQQAKNAGFSELTLATNGTLLTKENRQATIDCYDAVAVSLHNTPELCSVVDNLRLLREEAGSKRGSIRANIVRDEYTFAERYQLYQLLRRNRITDVKEFPAITEDLHSNVAKTQFYPVCPNKYYYLAVLWNGDTLPCCHMLSSGAFSLGNVSEKSLKQVFHGYKYKRLRQGYEKGTPCESCTVRR